MNYFPNLSCTESDFIPAVACRENARNKSSLLRKKEGRVIARGILVEHKSVKNSTFAFIYLVVCISMLASLSSLYVGFELREQLKGDKCEKSRCSTGQHHLTNPYRTWKSKKQCICLIYLDVQLHVGCFEHTIKNLKLKLTIISNLCCVFFFK